MKRYKFIFMFVLFTLLTFISNQAISESEINKEKKPITFSSRYKGQNYISKVSVEQLEKIPSWNPMINSQEPVSVGQAIKLALSVLKQFVPENERSNWRINSIVLSSYEGMKLRSFNEPMEKQHWFYLINFWNNMNDNRIITEAPNPAIEAKKEFFYIIVLMNDECIKPEIKKQ